MVSWKKAYYKALWIVGYSLIWWTVGGFIFIIGISKTMWSGGLTSLLISLIGVCIASLGPIAAIIKISAETKE